ncbi:MAG TPA: MFS transporter [Vicinamibacterales bacterium]|jgi:MFS family permease|nr:MFS transporter [Vicinamibacterales bacterium]
MSSHPAAPPRFAALRIPAYRRYFTLSTMSMMADNIEHVISYWVMFQTFHSAALGGFAVISHWVPFLLFSLYTGALADRHDCRRLIQISQALFMLASLSWGLLFLAGKLQMWHAVVLLIVHGFAGVIGAPATQLIIHDMVPPEDLPSAIRLNASSRYLSILLGPAVGGGLMLMLGPAWGLLANVLIYLPFTILLTRFPYTGHAARGAGRKTQPFGLADAWNVFATVRSEQRIMAMVVIAGVTSFFVGNAFQAQMPEYANFLGADETGTRYTMLLAADAVGAVIGVLLLETANFSTPTVQTAVVSAGLWGVTMGLFPLTHSYPTALALLVLAGVFNIAFQSMSQTLVQLLAPPHIRGRVVGLFTMAMLGLRAGSGLMVGLLGTVIGVRYSLAVSSLAVVLVAIALLAREARAGAAVGAEGGISV